MSTIGTALSVCLILEMSVYLFLLAPFFGQQEKKRERETEIGKPVFLVAGAKVHVKLIEVTARTGGEKEKTL